MTTSQRPTTSGNLLNPIRNLQRHQTRGPSLRIARQRRATRRRITAHWLLLAAATLLAVAPTVAQEPLFTSSTQLIAWDDDGSGGTDTRFMASTGHSYNTTIASARLRTLIMSALIYANDNNNRFPPLASMLFDEEYWYGGGSPDPCAFYSPGDSDPAPTTIDNNLPNGENSAQISFAYHGAGLGSADTSAIIFEENDDAYNGGLGKLVAYGDGHVKFVSTSPHPFKDISLTLDPCRRSTITRYPDGTQTDYTIDLPADAISQISGKLNRLRMRHEGSVSDSLFDIFNAEGWGTAFNSIAQSDQYVLAIQELTVTADGLDDVPLTFYNSFDSIVTVPLNARNCSASVNTSAAWHNFEDEEDFRHSASGVGLLDYGLLLYGDVKVLDASELQPGDDGYLPGHTSYRLRGIAQVTVEVPAGIRGYMNRSTSHYIRYAVHPGTAPGAFLRGDTTIELAAGGDPAQEIKAYLPLNYTWIQQASGHAVDAIIPYHRGDSNLDHVVLVDDANDFIAAFTGPDNASLEDFENLQVFDFDGDGDIDCDDYALFAEVFMFPPEWLPQIPRCNDTYSVSISTIGEGNVSVQPHAGPFLAGEHVWLIAEQRHDCRFAGWQGDASGSAPAIELVIDGNLDITAVFEQTCGLGLEMSGVCRTPADNPQDDAVVAPCETLHGPIRHAEQFTSPQAIEVQAVRWYGGYSSFLGGDCSADDPGDHFIINLYDDDNGLPGDLLLSCSNPALVERSTTGKLRTPPYLSRPIAEYRFSYVLDAPFVAAANTPYWLEIRNDRTAQGANPCLWFWSTAEGGDAMSLADYDGDGYGPEDIESLDLSLCLMMFDSSNDDCNRNGIPDACDVADGTSPDCNGNQIPDDCDEDVRPNFTQQPQSMTVNLGAPAAFTVAAQGTNVSYRWQKNGQYIPGAVQNTYTIAAATAADAGVYRAEAVSDCGNRFSDTATLTVVESYTLDVDVEGDGCSVTLNPPGGVYPPEQTVTLTAHAAIGWQFDHWEGAASGTSQTTQVVMTNDLAVTAVFVQPTYSLNISVIGHGRVDIVPDHAPVGGKYVYGTRIRMTAVSYLGWHFAGWSGGGLNGLASPITITMVGDRNITATFAREHLHADVLRDRPGTGRARSTERRLLTGTDGDDRSRGRRRMVFRAMDRRSHRHRRSDATRDEHGQHRGRRVPRDAAGRHARDAER